MSIRLMNDAWDTDLPTAHKMVLLTLCDFADDDGRNCWPSVATVAGKASLSDRQAQRVLHSLIDDGFVAVMPGTENGGRATSRRYLINVDRMAKIAADARARKRAQKGDILSPFPVVDNSLKGDTHVTLSEPERVTSETERVTSTTLKGDTHVTQPTINNHNSNHQGEACASAHVPAPEKSSSATGMHGGIADPEPMVTFPDDWQPDQRCRDVLAARKKPMPAQHVVDAFAAHWSGRMVEPRRIANEFLKWVCREQGMRGGVVPVDGPDGGKASTAVKAEAAQAWEQIREANQRGKVAAGGWKFPNTIAALQKIGGWNRLADMLSRDVPFVKREYEAAYFDLVKGSA